LDLITTRDIEVSFKKPATKELHSNNIDLYAISALLFLWLYTKNINMPYQCITERGNLLVAARDSNIDLFNLEDGSHLSTWAFPSSEKVQDPKSVVEEQPKTLATQESQSSSVDIIINSNSPPAKRRKLSSGEAEKQETPIKESEQELASNSNVTVQKNGINGKQQKKQKQNNRSVAISTGLEPPAIIALTVSDDEKHVVAVTGEDKCIRVFEVVNEEEKVKLVQISERYVTPYLHCYFLIIIRVMAKRPSSIAISRDSTTILSADKFGDVYSLPLLQAQSKDPETHSSTPTVDKPFKPSANELTIHSQRNRIALENQKRHHNSAPKNLLPTFEHTLLLGHVSLLIDLKLVTLEEKTYIITADRDEHIRVSRGIPQAHIIEGFCLGHREFVSKLCVPKPRPEVLVSGGGDDELFLWNWRISMLLCKVDLREQARKILGNEEKDRKIAVSGIYDIRHDGVDLILVTIEA
jgi:tRNA (guanine-N(7)-)-methyltransferase subunit TRM82